MALSNSKVGTNTSTPFIASAKPKAADLLRIETRKEQCELHGEFVSERFLNIWSRCPECAEEYKRQREKDEAEQRITERLASVGIPPRFVTKTFGMFEAVTKAQKHALEISRGYVDDFAANHRDGRCLVYLGNIGAGKTHLACAIAIALARAGFRPRYTTVGDAIRALRESWRSDAKRSEAQVLQELSSYDLLILDEVGVQFGSDGELTQLTGLLDNRYRNLKPTLAISNLDKAGLEEFLGARAVDRLRENGGQMVIFNWGSHRQ